MSVHITNKELILTKPKKSTKRYLFPPAPPVPVSDPITSSNPGPQSSEHGGPVKKKLKGLGYKANVDLLECTLTNQSLNLIMDEQPEKVEAKIHVAELKARPDYSLQTKAHAERLRANKQHKRQLSRQNYERLTDEEIKNRLFDVFANINYLTLSEIHKSFLSLPKTHLKQVLSEICNYHREGSESHKWSLKDEYRSAESLNTERVEREAKLKAEEEAKANGTTR